MCAIPLCLSFCAHAELNMCRPAFTGKGNKLGRGGASTSAAAAPQQPVAAWSGPDDSQPVTSIQIRMPDGSRLVGRFNHSQKVSEIRAFVAAARPGQQQPGVMMVGFPSKPVENEDATIEEAGLISAVVIFK
jgi:UBX domain-containing protein 1